jgi:hypothetical protein
MPPTALLWGGVAWLILCEGFIVPASSAQSAKLASKLPGCTPAKWHVATIMCVGQVFSGEQACCVRNLWQGCVGPCVLFKLVGISLCFLQVIFGAVWAAWCRPSSN